MRISVEHHTHYRFSQPQSRLVQMLRLTPSDTQDQTVVGWHIGVDCDARLRRGIDGFGNCITMLYAEGPISAIDIVVTGEVLTTANAGVIYGSDEPLPPMLFLRSTPRTQPNEAIAQFAGDAIAAAGDALGQIHALNSAIHGKFAAVLPSPDDGLRAADAFGRADPSRRDLVHIFLAGARSQRVPARYVTGYRWDGEAAHCAPHAWAEAHVEGIGWVGFDPSTGLSPDETYVRGAIGLDAPGAAPIAGTRIGEGSEKLDVELQVSQSVGDE